MLSNPRLFTRPPRAATLVLLATLACCAWAPAATAQVLKAWAPQGDSLSPLASSARIRFQRQQGDTVAGDNYEAYEIVGGLGRRLFAALGKTHLSQARAAQATLDSLGLDVEVATDPETPNVVFMLVRNPFRRSSDAVGYLYWTRDTEMHMQGASFPPAHAPVLRAWWTGREGTPYEAAVLYRNARANDLLGFDLFRMDPTGRYWTLVQYAGHGPEFGRGAHASFVDVNGDGQPELVGYQPSEPDSYFVVRSGTLPTLQELTFTERPDGFVLHDARAMPGPTETLSLFTALLVQKDPARARRLLLRPALLDTLLRLGWGRHHERGAFTVEYGEPSQPWPEWLEMRVVQDSGVRRWIVQFYIQDERWVIRDFKLLPEDDSRNRVVPIPASQRSKRP